MLALELKTTLFQKIQKLERDYVCVVSEFYEYNESHPFVDGETISASRRFLDKMERIERSLLSLKQELWNL